MSLGSDQRFYQRCAYCTLCYDRPTEQQEEVIKAFFNMQLPYKGVGGGQHLHFLHVFDVWPASRCQRCTNKMASMQRNNSKTLKRSLCIFYNVAHSGLTNNPVRAGKLRTLTRPCQCIVHDGPSVYTRRSVAPKDS